MNNKEILQSLYNDGERLLSTMLTYDDQRFDTWHEKVLSVINSIYGKDSPEYIAVSSVNFSLPLTSLTTDEEVLDSFKDGIRSTLAKIEAIIFIIDNKHTPDADLLRALIDDGKIIAEKMNSIDDYNHLVWLSKTRCVVRKVYGTKSREYEEITYISPASFIMTSSTTDAELVMRDKERMKRKVTKLQAWLDLMEEE